MSEHKNGRAAGTEPEVPTLCTNCLALDATPCARCGNPVVDRRLLSGSAWNVAHGATWSTGERAAGSRLDLARQANPEPEALVAARIASQEAKAAVDAELERIISAKRKKIGRGGMIMLGERDQDEPLKDAQRAADRARAHVRDLEGAYAARLRDWWLSHNSDGTPTGSIERVVAGARAIVAGR